MPWFESLPSLLAQADAPALAPSGMPWYVVLPIVAGVLVLPFLFSTFLTRRWRMPDYQWKVGLVLLTVFAGVAVVATRWPPKLGIDLQGGVRLVYGIEKSQTGDDEAAGAQSDRMPTSKAGMDKLVGAIKRRVDPAGTKDPTIRPYGNSIEIIIPQVDRSEVDRLKGILSSVGTLEFRILATRQYEPDKRWIDLAEKLSDKEMTVRDAEGKIKAFWVPVAEDALNEFNANDPKIVTRQAVYRGAKRLELLVIKDNQDVTGKYLLRATKGIDDRTGGLAVDFAFNSEGGQKFGTLTTAHQPNEVTGFKFQLGVILDGELQSAPQLNSPIHDRGQITGHFNVEAQDKYVSVLNAGALPATLTKQPLSEDFIGPSLGDDTIRMARTALILSTVAVCGFMLVYYRFSGIMACLALAMNCLLLMMFMLGIPDKVALSLPGLAGFALTIGMAVDSNVLIYERMREELDRGATLRMAVRNGFERAFSAIFDSHLTTLISAAVLFFIGEEAIKGFAVTLFLGVAINLYTAVFCVHVAFDVAERQGWIGRLKMMRMLTKTNVDFWGLRRIAYTASVLITVVGLAATYVRWTGYATPGMLNIDFTGGVSVQPVFRQPQDVSYVRAKLEKEDLPDLAVSDVQVESRRDERPGFRRQYVINTSNPKGEEPNEYLRQIQAKLNEAFSGELETNAFQISQVSVIEPPGQPAAPAPASKPEAKPAAKPETKPDAKKVSGGPLPWDGWAIRPTSWDGWTIRPTLAATGLLTAAEEPKPAASAPAKPEPTAPKPGEPGPAADAVGRIGNPSSKPTTDKSGEPGPASTKPTAAEPSEPSPAAAKTPVAAPAKPAAAALHGPPVDVKPRAAEPVKAAVSAPPAATIQANAAYFGGTRAELQFERGIDHDSLDQLIRDELQTQATSLGVPVGSVRFELSNEKYTEGDSSAYSDWQIDLTLPKGKAMAVLTAVQQRLHNLPYFASSSAIGSSVASETLTHALEAIIVSNILIMIYLWIRFQRLSYGVAAVVALIHDVFVALGFLAFSAWLAPALDKVGLGFLKVDPFKIGMTEVAAFLTIVGYSVSDTVVVFDRIREVKGKAPEVTPTIINASINQTLSRTILTSLTAWMVVWVLYFLGGPTIHGFSFAMIIGILTGTYSSIYVAAPLLLAHKPHIARAHEEAKELAGRG